MGWSDVGKGAGEGAIAGVWGGPVGMAIGAGIGAVGSIWGSKIQANAAEDAAKKQSDSNAATLAFQKQQAENTFQNSETTRHANYDQWAARQQAMNKTRTALGLAPQDIPAYVPGVDPHLDPASQPYVGGTPGPNASPEAKANYAAWVARQPPGGPTQQSAFAPAGTTTNPSTNLSGPTGNPQSYFNSLFPGQTLTPEQLAAQESNLNAHGIKLLRNAAGRAGKILLPDGTAVDVIQGAGSGQNVKQWLVQSPSGAPPATSPIARNVGSYLQPNDSIGIAPGVQLPQSPYQPFSVGSYF